ncbi:AgmX/PglI C-terminal domain-containing protein [Myxococcaceae bacterium GXIMD 01537]
MNFSCDKCQRRYSIADEKVRGKTVKVRCKHCQNVISVEGPPAEVEESTRVVSLADVERLRAQAAAEEASAAAVSAAAEPEQNPWEDEPTRAAPMRDARAPWFAMVKNQQQGPLDEAALRELVDSGAVNARSYFWQPGLADWKRGSDIAELAPFFAPPPAPEPPPPPPPAPEPVRKAPEPARRAAPAPVPEPEPQPAWQEAAAEQEPAWGASADAGNAPWEQEPAPAPAPARAQPAASNDAPLGELFSDLDLPGRSEENDFPEDNDQGALPEPEPAPKPAKGKGKKSHPEPPGENTRVAMVQSGVTRRNPWWKVALVIVLVIVLPLAGAFALDQLHVVPITVTRVDAQGKAVKQSVFSAEGAGELKDRLMGRKREPPPPPPEPVQEQKPTAVKPADTGAPKQAPAEAVSPEAKAAQEELKAVYAQGDKQDVGPDVRKDAEVAATDSAAAEKGGPPPEELQKVIGQVQPAIQACVDAELKKNPRFRGGKVTLLATVGNSGVVKKVSFDRTDVDGSTVGDCIRTRAKRMVFSAFQGDDVELQVPLVLGTSM